MVWELFFTLTLLCAWIYGIALCYLHSNRVMFMAFSKWKGGPVCWSCWLSMAHDPINKGPICSVDQFFVPQVSITCPCYRSCLDNRNLFSINLGNGGREASPESGFWMFMINADPLWTPKCILLNGIHNLPRFRDTKVVSADLIS